MRPELSYAGDVGHGLAADAAPENVGKTLRGELIEFVLRMCKQVAAWHINGLAQQDLCVEPG